MVKRRKYNNQLPLQFECESCFYKLTGRCKGPTDFGIYAKQGSSNVPCVDTLKRQQFFDDLYSQMPPPAKTSHHSRIALPPFIPQIKDGLKGVPDFSFHSLYAISLGFFLTVRNLPIAKLRTRLKLPASSRIALIGTANDYAIERMWTKSEKTRIWEEIGAYGFEFVTSTTFSVYDEDTRATQIFNQDRNFMTYDRLANLGVPTIPFFFPFNEEDYEDAFSWLRARPDINKIAMNAQFQKTEKQFDQFLESMRVIKEGATRSVEFLVVGVAKSDRLQKIFREFNASIVSGSPFHKASAGYMTDDHLDHPDNDLRKTFTPARLAENNIRKFIQKCEEFKYQTSVRAQRVLTKPSYGIFAKNESTLKLHF